MCLLLQQVNKEILFLLNKTKRERNKALFGTTYSTTL
jgi:hypothetical protein